MMIKAVSDYMTKEGGVMSLAEYKSKGNEVPVKDYLLRRAFGSWSRVLSVVSKRYPVVIKEVTKKVAPKVTKKVEPKKVTKKVEKKDGK